MKKISLLKKLSIGTAALAAIAPITFTLSSCSKANAVETKYVSFDDLYESDGSASALKSGYFSKENLLLGSKKFFKGNYILFLGSNCFDSSRTFFSVETDTNRDVNLWFENHLGESIWYKDVMLANTLTESGKKPFEVKFGFATYIENYDFKLLDDKGHEIHLSNDQSSGWKQIIGPFDKWKESQITQTKRQTKEDLDYEWDDESVEEGEYIRQDKQAKAYRALCNKGAAMFPIIEKAREKTFDVADDNTTSLMVVYKNGRLMEIIDIPTKMQENPDPTHKETDTLYGTINKYYMPEEDPEEK